MVELTKARHREALCHRQQCLLWRLAEGGRTLVSYARLPHCTILSQPCQGVSGQACRWAYESANTWHLTPLPASRSRWQPRAVHGCQRSLVGYRRNDHSRTCHHPRHDILAATYRQPQHATFGTDSHEKRRQGWLNEIPAPAGTESSTLVLG